MTLDEILRRKSEKPEEREKKLEAAKKEVKARQQKIVEAKRAEKKKAPAPKAAPAKNVPAAAPKNVKGKKWVGVDYSQGCGRIWASRISRFRWLFHH